MTTEPETKVEILRPVQAKDQQGPSDSVTDTIETWWERYTKAVSSLPETTLRIVAADALFIAERAVPMKNGFIDTVAFGKDRIRSGIVVGSVQSGKTASMLSVAALLLDNKIDILVVLAGTRVALWLQTYERILNQLDGSDMLNAWKRNSVRTLVPQPEDVLSDGDRVDPISYLRGSRTKVKTSLAARRPVIFIVPKEDDHLLALGRFLGEQLIDPQLLSRQHALTMIVLDDEADDASVLDAADSGKITPKFIQQLWTGRGKNNSTLHPNLFASYIAYTATPQANYLQQTHNPLAPRDFHASLRVPSDRGAEMPLATTYMEPAGLGAYYTGGDFYYERFKDLKSDPCHAYPFPTSKDLDNPLDTSFRERYESIRWQMIGDSLRSFFVAAAMRLIMSGKKIPISVNEKLNKAEIDSAMPPIQSMLYHPSALKDDQFAGAADIVRWSKYLCRFATSVFEKDTHDDTISLILDQDGLKQRLLNETEHWILWLEKFQDSSAALSPIPGGARQGIHNITWETVKETLLNEIFPNIKLKVLNSDPRASDRPEFAPVRLDNDHWRFPADILTIFVAGNVLSRGLTVEGLTTSLFLRSAKEPAADTQMQMQRWFGYRGKYFEYCKVFAFSDQLALFRQYHTNDQAIKTEILNDMDSYASPVERGILVLQGESFKATSKVETRKIPLHPGPTPSIKLVDPTSSPSYHTNIAVVSKLINSGSWEYLEYPKGTQRGLIKSEPVSMLEVAAILESLRYARHDPSKELDLSQRWASLEKHLDLSEPLFRPPAINPGPMAVDPSSCPYSIAAYLRLWDAALKRPNTPGLRPTDNPSMPWNLINVKAYRDSAPRFFLGVRFGSDIDTTSLAFKGQPFKTMRRGFVQGKSDLLATLWGSRNPTERWFGDQVFDYHFHNPSSAPKLLQEGAWRPRGDPGLLLLHIIVEPETNREMVAVGLALPHGGPDHVAALRGA